MSHVGYHVRGDEAGWDGGWDPAEQPWQRTDRDRARSAYLYGPRRSAMRRPTYREPHPVRPSAVGVGMVAATGWYLLFTLVSWSRMSYAWATVIAGVLATLAAWVLIRYGDRGVGIGVAVVSAFGVGIAGLVVGLPYFLDGQWILW